VLARKAICIKIGNITPLINAGEHQRGNLRWIYWTDQSLDLTPEPVVRKETTRIKTRRVCKFVILTVSRMGHVLFALFVFVCAQWCPIHIVFCRCMSGECLFAKTIEYF
jgi:hypothetical protein